MFKWFWPIFSLGAPGLFTFSYSKLQTVNIYLEFSYKQVRKSKNKRSISNDKFTEAHFFVL